MDEHVVDPARSGGGTATVAPASVARRLKPLTVLPVWLLTLVAAVLLAASGSRDTAYVWLPLVLAGSVVVTFVLQLATREKDGLVSRTILSTCGSLVILAVATLVVETT